MEGHKAALPSESSGLHATAIKMSPHLYDCPLFLTSLELCPKSILHTNSVLYLYHSRKNKAIFTFSV